MKIAYTGSHFPEEVWNGINGYLNEQGFGAVLIKLREKNAKAHLDELRGYGVIICSGEAYDCETVKDLADGGLKLLSRHGVGTDEIDKAAAKKYGVSVANAAGSLSACVAECALALTLNVLHGYGRLDRRMRQGHWDGKSHFTSELRKKTVGLVGFGGIAKCFAKYLSPFECKILAFDPFFDSETASRLGVKESSLIEIQKQSDVLSLHVPLTDETRGMIGIDFLRGMKPGAVVVNTSRGAVVDEAALCEALRGGIIAGAGLDVYENEPLGADSPLFSLDNVMLLPHVAAHSTDSQLAAGLMACRNAVNFIKGSPVESMVIDAR